MWSTCRACYTSRDISPEEDNPLVEYLDRTYVTGQLRLRNAAQQQNDQPTVRFRRIPPVLELAQLNVHAATLQALLADGAVF